MKKPWSGRFKQSTDQLMETFSASIGYDRKLYAHDIAGSIAHAKMLAHSGVIRPGEAKKIVSGLGAILKEFESGRFECRESLEDIHMNIESRLAELIGPVAGKLHTARSRNDQVCLDIRLYLRSETGEIRALLLELEKTLLDLAQDHIDFIMPGYTHLQRAQPVSLAHHLLAHLEMLERDRERLADALKRIDVMPLGSAALAGTNFPIDRAYTQKLLGFARISNNSIDAVSDRDFIIEFTAAAALIMMHLSRFAEEVVLWSTSEFDFIELSDAFSTGSSIMPQKKNPDPAELVRGKTGRVYGNLVSLLTMMKALPLAYNRDLQEDKEPLFDTVDTVKICLQVFTGMLRTARFKPVPIETLRQRGFLTATDMADYLVEKGLPFREAHEVTGRAVAHCLEKGKHLEQITLAELRAISQRFEDDIFDRIALEKSVDRKDVHGGTSRRRIRQQIARLRRAFRK